MAYGRIRKKSKWKKLTSEKSMLQNTSEKYCNKVDYLSPSDFTKYE